MTNQREEVVSILTAPQPIRQDFRGPFHWSRRSAFFMGWRKFKPITLSSRFGVHAITAPCDEVWWAEREEADVASYGYMAMLPDGDFIIEGGSEVQRNENARNFPIFGKTVIMRRNNTNVTFAEFDDELKTIRFADGRYYTTTLKHWIPLKRSTSYEFHDNDGKRQFHFDQENDIWLDDGVFIRDALYLITIEKYLMDLAIAEAPGG